MIFRKSTKDEAARLADISKAAFETDISVGGNEQGGPPGYDSMEWYGQMQAEGHLYTFLRDNGEVIGGAVLFERKDSLYMVYIGRIFISPGYFRQGYGMKLMKAIEETLAGAAVIKLDTPVWNIRTKRFYKKCGYAAVSRDEEAVCYEKRFVNGKVFSIQEQQ